MSHDEIKGQVRTFWNQDSCGTLVTKAPKGTRSYYNEIEAYRYRAGPHPCGAPPSRGTAMYLFYGPLKGKPFRTVCDVMYHHQESPGTKAHTRSEIRAMLGKYLVRVRQLSARATSPDLLWNRAWPFRWGAYALACLAGLDRCGFYMTIEFEKMGVFRAAGRPGPKRSP